MKPEQVQVDGSVIVDGKTYPLGSTLWEIEGHGFVPIDVIFFLHILQLGLLILKFLIGVG